MQLKQWNLKSQVDENWKGSTTGRYESDDR